MPRVTRRFFLVSATSAAVACASRREDSSPAASAVRAPATGQTWRYGRHDIYTRATVDEQLDQIVATGRAIEIDSRATAVKEDGGRDSWGAEYLRKYLPRRERPVGPLPSEIQDPWGMIRVDPHWGQVQVYETPIPLWPRQLEPGWRDHIVTRYKIPGVDAELLWDQTMKAHGWEEVTVPAGRFRTLRYTNSINFTHGDATRTGSARQETVWLAPEVGRWVARESTGSYFADDSAADQPYNENGYRWELLQWT
jgi:hypothetical protein